MSNRFLERQLKHAEDKPLGREEPYWDWDSEKQRSVTGMRRCNAAEKPPINPAHATPVGRQRGVAMPGSEAQGEDYRKQASPMAMTSLSPRKKRK